MRDKNGFAATGILYTILVIFLVLMSTLLVTLSSRARILNKLKENAKGEVVEEEPSLYDSVKLGDIIKMTPTNTSYTITAESTGMISCPTSGSSGGDCNSNPTSTIRTNGQIINPSQMKWWRVINKNSDGTIDVVSEYVQNDTNGDPIYLYSETGCKNYISILQTIAQQYTNNKYIKSTRYFGYNGQTLEISNSLTLNGAGTISTPSLSEAINPAVGQEYNNGQGGDTLYAKDLIALLKSKNVLDTDGVINTDDEKNALKAYKLDTSGNPTTSLAEYWLANRSYRYIGTEIYDWGGGSVTTNGIVSTSILYHYNQLWYWFARYNALRPVLTIKSDLPAVESTESGVNWVLE